MSALADVARLAGVSKATASRALSGRGYVSEHTRDAVARAAAQIGYVVSSNASSLVTGQTKNVGVVIPFLNRWFFAELLEGIESALLEAGYDLTLYRLTDDVEQRRMIFEYFLVRKRVDAVIAVSVALTDAEVIRLQSLGKPLVGVGGPVDGMTTLSIDDVAVAQLATEHLLSLGHRHIVHLGGSPEDEMDFSVHEKRLSGYRVAMTNAGLGDHGAFAPAPFSIEGGYRAALALLSDPRSRPTAVFAASDEIAIGLIIAARQLGIRVPQDLSVVGIDGHELSDMFGLTTLQQHPKHQGRLAVDLVLRGLAGGGADTGGSVSVPVDFAARSSTTAPARSTVA
ncbi:LacI family DNA-binding transcriptional regulator [Planctomonas psychrotolerans]|uniref:LacI family DNA-binding transcriptional regulator n=1 Tax=Planctomonas psychrotolerans TaxID=2528712 RepID=UPI00123C6469|nr:LacI family DNA-binding transcriptional regulator [Planctomonas psychrotolerans]